MKGRKKEEKNTQVAMPLVPLHTETSADKQPLVNNQSVNSFISENNQLTITRNSLRDPRKYETLCFQPTEDNRIDIVITKGEYRNGLQELAFDNYGSQAIRQQYSGKAKCLVGFVFLMLFTMLLVVLVCLFKGQFGGGFGPHEHPNIAVTGNNTNITDSTTTGSLGIGNETYTPIGIGNETYTPIGIGNETYTTMMLSTSAGNSTNSTFFS